jgi:hypothetical protein
MLSLPNVLVKWDIIRIKVEVEASVSNWLQPAAPWQLELCSELYSVSVNGSIGACDFQPCSGDFEASPVTIPVIADRVESAEVSWRWEVFRDSGLEDCISSSRLLLKYVSFP